MADNNDINTINTIAGLGRAQLRTLGFIRWVAIGGQSVTLLMVHYGLGFDLLLGPALLTVGASVLANVFFIIRTARGGRRKSEVAALFAFDLIQLSVLLYLTGGLQNPFSFLLLAPVAVSAAILSRATVLFLSGLAIVSVTVLSLWHMPLPWIGPIAPFPSLYVVGVWVSLAIGVLFFATYTYRVATESRQLSEALNATQMALAREQQVSAMGTLAAAAAHELGSPLGTIAVVAGEIAREIPEDSPHAEDIRLLVSETHRCRDILAALAQKPKVDTVAFSRVPISAVVEQSARLHKSEEIELSFDSCPRKGTKLREPMIRAAPEILHGLGNLIQNAIQFARKKVEIRVFWDDYSVQLNIQDDGSGFSQFVLDRIGEPYISSRHPSKGQMGLGIFIAQTLLERTGARLSFGNRQSGGAEICVNWKRELLDTGIHKRISHKIMVSDNNGAKQNRRSLLIVDDDAPFRERLATAMMKRGFDVVTADSVEAGRTIIRNVLPSYAVLDLRLGDGSGLDLVPDIRDKTETARVIILTGYGNIATAVAAVKVGAIDYLAKPTDADQVEAALLVNGDHLPPPPENPMSADRVRWEHIQRVFEQCDRNVSETARRLNMHRRTLQRILAKRAPREVNPSKN